MDKYEEYGSPPEEWSVVSDDESESDRAVYKDGETYIIVDTSDSELDVLRKFSTININIFYENKKLVDDILPSDEKDEFVDALEDTIKTELVKDLQDESIVDFTYTNAILNSIEPNDEFEEQIITEVYDDPTDSERSTITKTLNSCVYPDNELTFECEFYND